MLIKKSKKSAKPLRKGSRIKGESKLRIIIDNIQNGIVIIAENGAIETLNPSAEMMFGYREEELVGRDFDCLLPKPDQLRVQTYLDSQLGQHKLSFPDFRPEKKGVKKDGSMFTMDVGVSKINIDNQLLYIATIHDLTERIQIENKLRELSCHLQSALEDERTRIAREIHDELGSTLTALKMDLSVLKNLIPNDVGHSQDRIAAMATRISGAMATVRQISTDLRPSILDHLGLLAAIEWQVEGFRQQTGVECVLNMTDGSINMDEARATAVFRIVQEALTNITKHAKATLVNIDIEFENGNLHIKIQDNGVGIAPSQFNKPHSHGVQGMRERAENLGGSISFNSRPGMGTKLVLLMPQQT
jgi:PAS domain S-box-containing protein